MLCFRHTTLEAMHTHAREAYPEECCGFVLVDGEEESVRRITNVQNRMHDLDPVTFPRDAVKAYFMDPKELLAVDREISGDDWSIKALYHSHPNSDAYFSAEDRKQALFGDEPMYPPGVFYVVVSIYDREVRATRAYEWDEEERDFGEVPMGSPQREPGKDNDPRS